MKIKLLTIVRFGGTLRKDAKAGGGMVSSRPKMERKLSIAKMREASARIRNDAKATINEAKESAKNKATRWYKKVHGGSAGIPPAFTLRQCLWTFIGVIVTHTILSRINLLIKTESDGDLSLILAPLGKFEPRFSTLDTVTFL